MKHINLTKLTQLSTILAAIITISVHGSSLLRQCTNYIDNILLKSTLNASINYTSYYTINYSSYHIINSSSLNLTQATYPSFFDLLLSNSGNIFFSSDDWLIAIGVILLISVGLILSSGSDPVLKSLFKGILSGVCFDLIYFILRIFLSSWWLVADVIISLILGMNNSATKKTSLLDEVLDVLVKLVFIEILLKFIYIILVFIYLWMHWLFNVLSCIFG